MTPRYTTLPTPSSTTERRTFKAHPNLILQAIQRQAGSLSKAIMEGVMNAVDALATGVTVTCDGATVVIADNGNGFPSTREIDEFFNVFGQPHVEGDATFGTFRIGRGQLFSYGANVWRSGTFQMDVDIKQHGLDWTLADQLAPAVGCTITIALYDHLMPTELAELERSLKRALKWVAVPISYNGKGISTDPATATWDHVTDDAYIALRPTHQMSVYNLGVAVRDYGAHDLGCGGEIVSKAAFKLNTARNDIQGDCPIWRRLRPKCAVWAGAKVATKKAPMTDAERQFFATQLATGMLSTGARSLKLVTDVTGEHLSVSQLESFLVKRGIVTATVAPMYDRRGDKLQQEGRALVIATETLERFGAETLEALLALLRPHGSADILASVSVRPFEDVAADISADHRVLGVEALTPTERLVLDTLTGWQPSLFPRHGRWDAPDDTPANRRLLAGESETAEGWTDGQTYIAIHRRFLTGDFSAQFWTEVALLLLHEYAHEDPSVDTHVHDAAFYGRFHDTTVRGLPAFVDRCVCDWPRRLEDANRALGREVLRLKDRAVKIAKATAARVQLEADFSAVKGAQR